MTVPATADNLRELHSLHQRAKALRDRLNSAPKTLAARQAALANRQAALDAARKALQDAKVHQKTREHTAQSLTAKIDDYRVKLNQVKKNDEYKAIQNEIALVKNQLEKVEGEILEDMERVEEQTRKVAAEDAEVKAFAAEVETLRSQIESHAGGQRKQLAELDRAIVEAESIIPEEERERYRRTIKQHGADAMAPVDYDRKGQVAACGGCFVSVTTQALNELINGSHLSFCKSCGRMLYLAEEDQPNTRRG